MSLSNSELDAIEELSTHGGQTVWLSPDLCALFSRSVGELRVYREALAGAIEAWEAARMTAGAEGFWSVHDRELRPVVEAFDRARAVLHPKENQ